MRWQRCIRRLSRWNELLEFVNKKRPCAFLRRAFFLSFLVQETIAQTGIQITDEAQLRAVAEKILKGQQQ